MGIAEAFRHIYVWSGVWANMGWGSIIYLAALSSVDPALYEAATIDGASKWQKIIHIDIPSIAPTIIILLILSTGSILSVGFEKVFLMQNSLTLSRSEVISTYVYKVGIQSAQYSFSSAVGLFNNVINFIVLMLVNRISRKVSETSLW
jgi:putative aldouronate transport system permease protein